MEGFSPPKASWIREEMHTAEDQARTNIDRLLTKTGWEFAIRKAEFVFANKSISWKPGS